MKTRVAFLEARWLARAGIAVSVLAGFAMARAEGFPEFYGADAGGTRYAPLAEITPQNVGELSIAWSYRTGDLARREQAMRISKFQVTPILAGERLVFCTPFNEIIALDPGTGAQLWRFDPHVATNYRPANLFNCRGVALWRDPLATAAAACAARIFSGTNDGRVIAVDLASGKPCDDFGAHGEVKVDTGMPLLGPGEWQITSPPVAAGEVVIVGSAINDNQRAASPRGTVHAYDARSGKLRWQWDPIPREAADPAASTWGDGWKTAGSANVWAPMSVDLQRRLVFLPTSSASPDFYGGLRPGDNLHANSVVALRLDDGAMAWSFQTVHHDVWDYDVSAQPTLATIEVEGRRRDVVIAGNKQAMLFVLDRDTGRPVFPVEERAVPQAGATGETLSKTQPFPSDLPLLAPSKLSASDAWGVTPWDRGKCRDRIAAARNEGLYTPPSEQGTIVFPFDGGGIDWGGIAIDTATDVVYVNTSRLVHLVTLFPAADFAAMKNTSPGLEVSPQTGTAFGIKRELLVSPLKLPCNPPPWGVLSAVDLRAKRVLWEMPLGTLEELAYGFAARTGTPTFGGPLVTRGGLVFIGATLDHYLRAFDAKSGAELWTGRLPAAAIATPMSYRWRDRQYVVVAAGGRADAGGKLGDTIVAFALRRPGEAGPDIVSRLIDRPGGRFGAAAAAVIVLSIAAVLGVPRWRRRRVEARK
jgi:quinoprotein glucose dehydrogenase